MSASCVFLPPAACAASDPQLPVWRVVAGVSKHLVFADALPSAGQAWRLVLPVEAVTICVAQLPTTKARWLAKALPFAVEEQLAEDVELFHLCIGEALGAGRYRVYAVRRDWLVGWLALCGDCPPQRIEVDADLLSGEGSQLLCLGARWLLGGRGEARMALRPEDWPSLRGQVPAPCVAHVLAGEVAPEGVDEVHGVDQPYVWLARQPSAGNLAQGAFERREASAGIARWRPLLVLLVLCLVVQWGFNLAQGWLLRNEAERYARASEALYRDLFPDDNKLINLRAQFDQHLSEGSGRQDMLLGLLDQAATAINAEGAQVRIDQLDFSALRGDLALNIQAQDFAALERLRTHLQEAGVPVEMGSASRAEAGVSARLVIGGNG